MMSSHLGGDDTAGVTTGRIPYAHHSPPVVDLHPRFRSWIRRMRMARPPAQCEADLRTAKCSAGYFDVWSRPPGILNPVRASQRRHVARVGGDGDAADFAPPEVLYALREDPALKLGFANRPILPALSCENLGYLNQDDVTYVARWSGFDLRCLSGLHARKRLSNPELHRNLKYLPVVPQF